MLGGVTDVAWGHLVCRLGLRTGCDMSPARSPHAPGRGSQLLPKSKQTWAFAPGPGHAVLWLGCPLPPSPSQPQVTPGVTGQLSVASLGPAASVLWDSHPLGQRPYVASVWGASADRVGAVGRPTPLGLGSHFRALPVPMVSAFISLEKGAALGRPEPAFLRDRNA